MCSFQVQGFSTLTQVWDSAPSLPWGRTILTVLKQDPPVSPSNFFFLFPLSLSDERLRGSFWKVDHKHCRARLSKAVDNFLLLRTHKGDICRTNRNNSGSSSYDTECHSSEGASKIKGESRVPRLWFCNLILSALGGLWHLSIHRCC